MSQPQLQACGHWDALSRRGTWRDVDDARGYYARGHHPGALFTAAARSQWLDDAPRPARVRRGWLRCVPYCRRETHPELGELVDRGHRLVEAPGPGRGAWPATWWWGNDPKEGQKTRD